MTLFWYIFWSLLRVFLMTTCALAGIMSFAGALRPLTENGLELGQVNRLLAFMMPAMGAYSLPVAALFATTFVYGRFSADNELTAMRASGISYLSPRRFAIALPAVVLGLLVAVINLVMLCFIVPVFSQKATEVLYSNIARVIQNQIERTHEINYSSGGNSINIYAAEARLLPPDPKAPWLQRVELIDPAMMNYYVDPHFPTVPIPKEFMLARNALISVDRAGESQPATLTVSLTDGIKFPRQFFGNIQGGVGDTGFGPIEITSLPENVKFLNVTKLARMAEEPGLAQRVQIVVRDLIQREQGQLYLKQIWNAMNTPAADGSASYLFVNDSAESDTFRVGGQNAEVGWQWGSAELVIKAPGPPNARSLWLQETNGSQQILFVHAKELHIHAQADPTAHRMSVKIDLLTVQLTTPEGSSDRGSYNRDLSVPMPTEVRNLEKKTLAEFTHDPVVTPSRLPPPDQWALSAHESDFLYHEQIEANNAARSELHARASFAMSCLSLVVVGCALGVMFKSGNFLNAFAASFVPAIMCITLVICGQQVATHVPDTVGAAFHDPLHFGLCFIWIGNVLVLAVAGYLTIRLQKR